MSLSQSHSTSISLLERAVAGESIAWQRLIQFYGPLVYTWARRFGLGTEDAADVTQETFAAASQQLKRLDLEKPGATFRGWLRTVCRNKCSDFFRNQQGRLEPAGGTSHQAFMQSYANPILDSESNLDEASEHRDKQEVIRRVLETIRGCFERKTWQAFWRTTVDGVDPQEVAVELEMSRWAVYKCRSRVLKQLRNELLGLEDLV